MSSTSSSPEPPLTVLKSKPKAKKSRKKTPSASQAAASGRIRNEGVDPTWAYKPPPGVVLLDTSQAHGAGGFDWDAVADNPDLELWLIRVPDAIKPKSLENATIAPPASSSKSACVGMIHRKHASFDIWSVGDDDNEHVSGEEIKSISCLLPKNGTLYPAPRPIARHFVVAAQAVTPTPDPSTVAPSSSQHTNKNPPRHSYPKDMLKHRFLPIGALAGDADAMDVDVDMEEIQPPESEQALVPSEPELTHTKKKQKKTKEKVAKVDVDMDVDVGADEPSENLEPQPTPTPTQTQTQTKHKKEKREKKDKKGTESLSQVEMQVDGTPANVKAKKRKSLGNEETPVGATAKKAKKAKA